MARLPAMIDDLAEHDVRGRPTVWLFARTIREAGLIRTAGRGRGGAVMMPEDAAALLIALCATDSPKDAPEATRTFAALRATAARLAGTLSDDAPAEELAQVALQTTFGGAVAELIRSAGPVRELLRPLLDAQALDLESVLSRDRSPFRDYFKLPFRFRVRLHSPTPFAEIDVELVDRRDGRSRRFYRSFTSQAMPVGLNDRIWGLDRSIIVELGFSTFIRLHRLLASGNGDAPTS